MKKHPNNEKTPKIEHPKKHPKDIILNKIYRVIQKIYQKTKIKYVKYVKNDVNYKI